MDLAERAEFLARDPEIRRRVLSTPPSRAHATANLTGVDALLKNVYRGGSNEEMERERARLEVIDLCLRMDDETPVDLYARDLISLEAFEAIMDVRLCGITWHLRP